MNKRSFLLNDSWDITLDGAGNIATTSGRYCDAQNVANAVRLFTNDAYLAQTKGVPHFSLDLGIKPALSEVRAVYRTTAMEVENIRDVTVHIEGLDTDTRSMTGRIEATRTNGDSVLVEF